MYRASQSIIKVNDSDRHSICRSGLLAIKSVRLNCSLKGMEAKGIGWLISMVEV